MSPPWVRVLGVIRNAGVLSGCACEQGRLRVYVSGIHLEFSFPVIPDMFTYPERCPPALSVYVLTHPDP